MNASMQDPNQAQLRIAKQKDDTGSDRPVCR